MPLKPIRDDKELLAIPVDEPVLVELEPAPSGADGIAEPEKPAKPAAKPEPDADDGVKALQTLLADQQRASAAENARLASERDEALRERDDARTAVADTEADLIANGLTSAQSEAKSARAALKAARDLGDVDAEADASERIARAAADVREFERAAAQIAEREKAPKPEPRRERPDINATIDAMQLLPAEKDWLRQHQDAITDPRQRTRLDAAYLDAMDEKIIRGSAEYFAFVDKRLGYAKPASGAEEGADERTVMPAAPVSRDNRSVATGRAQPLSPSQVHLTPEQRQIARDIGISDSAYARGVQKLAANKAADPEKYARTA